MHFHLFKVGIELMKNYFHSYIDFIDFDYSISINYHHQINFISLHHHHTAWDSLFFDTQISDYLL